MKQLLVAIFLIIGFSGHASAADSGDGTAAGPVYYVGFNHFSEDQGAGAAQVFTDYKDAIAPIMARYGLTLKTYRVVHAQSDAIEADAITFGTAPDQQSFAAFFADPDFQAQFPKLVGIIKNHVVIFTSEPLAPKRSSPGRDTRLSLYWLKGDTNESAAALLEVDANLAGAKRAFGVTDEGEARGVFANRGLAAEITVITPPDMLMISSFRDAHGYYDDDAVEAAQAKAQHYIAGSSVFWLKEWN